ncbi:MAG: hypothetical protein KAI95_19035, partial [Bacteroidales bacterium]|nr:hypothetical protein [Bacteroidales bacterium]
SRKHAEGYAQTTSFRKNAPQFICTHLLFTCPLQGMVVASLAMQITAICDAEDHDGGYFNPLLIKL